ncbi:Putative WD40/YVTN repeat-like-containing domain superfamily [Colletotrichum destructivum]|uniref:WD40/YVTN repeat-like-containing domain superfamily n=1 Tax=Colletotrichum destructivum TaxID=34406 RepID=A0AAX4IWY5_9PEZI|nr:Putative WD40/YVTN repeat-like-containing domain superfamily [Colletotrichum destructivum]
MDLLALWTGVLAVIFVKLSLVEGTPQPTRQCAPIQKGSFTIQQYQLYPENADWDVENCILYFGYVSSGKPSSSIAETTVRSLFNASVAVYDPYKEKTIDIIMFDGITHNPSLHIGGVQVDPHTKLVSIVVDAAAPFNTGGRDISGDNFIIKYDAAKKRVLWNKNITSVSKGQYAGFQDIGHDPRGNTYIVGSFPGTILKVDREGSAVVPWYLPAKVNHTKIGFSGLAATGNILLSNSNEDFELYRFDMKAEKGSPVLVPRSPNTALAMTDAIYLPPVYGNRVLLVAENTKGITVLRSKDGSWQSAEHLGTVPNDSPLAQGGTVTAAVQVGSSIYMVEEFFADPPVMGSTAGNRSAFPMVDITSQVEDLLKR